MKWERLVNLMVDTRFNLGLAFFYLLSILPSYFLGWLNSKVYISLISIWALVEARLSNYTSARAHKEAERGNS